MRERYLCLAAFVIGCSRDPSSASVTTPRPAVLPVWSVATETNRAVPDPMCTCATPNSSPAPSKFEADCDERFAVCGDVHYMEYLARMPSLPDRDRLGRLLVVHEVETMIWDATITFPAPPNKRYAMHDSAMRVHRGDVIPTPQGRARVVQIYRSWSDGNDDGRVRLHFDDRYDPERQELLFVSSGAPSHVHNLTITLIAASGGVAEIMTRGPGPETLRHVKRGDRIATGDGDESYPVIEVVDGRAPDAELGWVTIDTTRTTPF